MKKTILMLLVAVISGGVLLAQTPQVPDFKNQPMILKTDGSLDKLEKQNSEIKVKQVPYVGTTRFLSFTGPKSPVRTSASETFIIKVDAETDPETVLYLQKCSSGGKNRELDMMKVSNYAGYGAKGKSVKKDQVKLNFEKVSTGVYKFTAEGLTPKTEYGFVNSSQGASGAQSTVFLFGVD